LLDVGDILDTRFSLTRMLGEGDTGRVFAATHTQLGRQVAVKVLHPLLGELRPAIERYFQEARAASSTGHPGVVQILDAGFVPGSTYLVMELLRGESLAQRLKREGPSLPADHAVEVCVQVLSTLNVTHQQGIVHRDLKPGNVFQCQGVRGAGSIKVLDFGISQLILKEGLPLLTRAGALLETARYTSPEMARDGNADHRTDVWGTGVLLYRLVTGRLPYDGATFNGIVGGILAGPAPAPRTYLPDVNEDLERILARALARDPERRYQRVADFLDDLLAFRGELSHGIAADTPLTAAFDVRTSALPPTPTKPAGTWLPAVSAEPPEDEEDDDDGDEPTMLEDPSLIEEVSAEELIEGSVEHQVQRFPKFSEPSGSQEVTMPRPGDTHGPSGAPEAEEVSQNLSLAKTTVAPPTGPVIPPMPQPGGRPAPSWPVAGPPVSAPRQFPSTPPAGGPGPGGADFAATKLLEPSPTQDATESMDEPYPDPTQVYRPSSGQVVSPRLGSGASVPGFGGPGVGGPGIGGPGPGVPVPGTPVFASQAAPGPHQSGPLQAMPAAPAGRASTFGQPQPGAPPVQAPAGKAVKQRSKGGRIVLIFIGLILFLGIAGGAATALLWVFVWSEDAGGTETVAAVETDAAAVDQSPDAGVAASRIDAAVVTPPPPPTPVPDAATVTPPVVADAAAVPTIEVGEAGAAPGEAGAPVEPPPPEPAPIEPLPPEPVPTEPLPPEPVPVEPPPPTAATVDDAVVEAALGPLADRVRRCTRIEEGYHPRELELHMDVRPDGHLNLRGITPPTPVRVIRCIGGVVREVSLPVAGGDRTVLSYTYRLR
jgi:serine/threonine-protein kinase